MEIRPETHFAEEQRRYEAQEFAHESKRRDIDEQAEYLYREALHDSAAFQTMQDSYEVVDMDLVRVALWQIEHQFYDDAQDSMRMILARMKLAAKHQAEKEG